MMIHSEYLVLKVPEAVIIHSLIPYHKVILCYGISLRIACRLLRQDCAVTENKMPLSGEIVENNTPFPPLIICRLTIRHYQAGIKMNLDIQPSGTMR